MQLTRYTDYSLRVLIYVGLADDITTISEMAEHYKISQNHLMKVVHHLGKLGYVDTQKGRSGGVRLAKDPSEINIGEVVQNVEPNFHIVECFDRANNQCPITPICALKSILGDAHRKFMDVLCQFTLEDCLHDRAGMNEYFKIG